MCLSYVFLVVNMYVYQHSEVYIPYGLVYANGF
jgi:hypothetical protein